MGDRCNIIFKQTNGLFLGLYHHNGGYQVKELASKGIRAVMDAGREKDEVFANRIAISHIIGKRWDQEYDYGISVGKTINETIADNERDVVVIDFANGEVKVYAIDFFSDSWTIGEISKTYTLNEFTETF